MNPAFHYVVVTPARDEVANLGRTIESMVAQQSRPAQWIIVDDGSTDGTGELLDATARRHPWIRPCHRGNRGRRINGGGVMQAVGEGLAMLTVPDWHFLAKLDADLSFGPDYFTICGQHFRDEPALGIGGGVVGYMVDGRFEAEGTGAPPFHVRGATKIYRRACWDAIGGLHPGTGWDTIDELKANMLGWQTRTFHDLPVVQHRRTGGADGAWRNAVKNGRANYITGYHPLFMLLKCARRTFARPPLVGAAGLAWGYFSACCAPVQRVPDRNVVRYVRTQQLRRLCLRPSIWQ